MIFGGRYYANTYLYFTGKNNCILIINGYLKYYFDKNLYFVIASYSVVIQTKQSKITLINKIIEILF